MSDYKWKPIEPLSDQERATDLIAITPLYESWRTAYKRLKLSSSASLEQFTNRLVRRLSVETGILERLYELDRGTTEALVANGFTEDLVSRSSTDIEPSHLIDILRDQESAIQLVIDCVSHRRNLTLGLVNELHAILTKHQEFTTAVDQFGNRFEIPFKGGQLKEQLNNPQRPNGSVHEYCPPVHVQSEMENLMSWLSTYSKDDPIIVSAWLHHRLTQIHPYQDGNGRIGRVLTTLILLRAGLLPLVIDRDLRVQYIHALEIADRGNLAPLALLFANLEKNAILQALSIDLDAEVSHERTLTEAVIDSLLTKFKRRKEAKDTEFRQVNSVALSLRTRTRSSLEASFNTLKEPLLHLGDPVIHMTDGGPDRNNSHWYKYEVVQSGAQSGKYINFDEEHYFLKASMRVARERLIFVTSFHQVGREPSGIMEATAFARLESYEVSEDRDWVSQDFFPCSLEPFVFTWKTDEVGILGSFDAWLDATVAVAIKEYGDRL